MGKVYAWPIISRTTPERRKANQLANGRMQFRQGVARARGALKEGHRLRPCDVTTSKGANVMLGIRAYAASQMHLYFWPGPVKWCSNDRTFRQRLRDWLVWMGWRS